MVGGHHKHNGEPSEEHSGGSVQFGRDCVTCGSRGNALRIAAAATAAAATVATATAAAMATQPPWPPWPPLPLKVFCTPSKPALYWSAVRPMSKVS